MAAGPVSRICQAALQTEKLFEIRRPEASMMLTLAVMAAFASHWRHNPATGIDGENPQSPNSNWLSPGLSCPCSASISEVIFPALRSVSTECSTTSGRMRKWAAD